MQVLSETLELGLIVLSAFVWLLFSRNWAVFVRIWHTRLHTVVLILHVASNQTQASCLGFHKNA